MLRKSYTPLSFVVATRVWLVSLWRIVTVAPGTTAPVGSVTLPSNVPYRACAVHTCGVEKFRRVARPIGTSQRMLRDTLRSKGEPPFDRSPRTFGLPRHAIAPTCFSDIVVEYITVFLSCQSLMIGHTSMGFQAINPKSPPEIKLTVDCAGMIGNI